MAASQRRKPCPECGRKFYAQGLPPHRRTKHGVVDPGAVDCPRGCGAKIMPRTMTAHLRRKHGQVARQPARVAPKPAGPVTFTVLPYVVLEASDGGVYLAERIR